MVAKVAVGSKAVILKVGNDFRSSPNSGHAATASACRFRARRGHESEWRHGVKDPVAADPALC
jgi:hypothetical protein